MWQLNLFSRTRVNAIPTSNFQPIRLLDPNCCYRFTYLIANIADPNQFASADLDLHCLQRQDISGFSSCRVNKNSYNTTVCNSFRSLASSSSSKTYLFKFYDKYGILQIRCVFNQKVLAIRLWQKLCIRPLRGGTST